jgi:hypothetical protein
MAQATAISQANMAMVDGHRKNPAGAGLFSWI